MVNVSNYSKPICYSFVIKTCKILHLLSHLNKQFINKSKPEIQKIQLYFVNISCKKSEINLLFNLYTKILNGLGGKLTYNTLWFSRN